MKRLSDREKAELQVEIGQERTKRAYRIDEKPSVSLGRVMGEFLVGGVGGYAGLGMVSILWFLLSLVASRHLGEWAEIPLAVCQLVVVAVTYSLGSAIGVYLVGNIGDRTASFVATWVGSFAGGIVGIGIYVWDSMPPSVVALYLSRYLSSRYWPIVILSLLAAPTGAIIGFNLTRRYKSLRKLEKG